MDIRPIHTMRSWSRKRLRVDGDTFKLGKRKVRIIGIDAPETHPTRCTEEARLGQQATAKLRELLNQEPLEMVRPFTAGRTATAATSVRSAVCCPTDTQSIADDMRESGLARRYLGGFKPEWC